MCGFLGVVDRRGADIELAGLESRITRQLLQRGPDVCKSERAPGYYLAHSRLSITDESSAADQPFTNAARDRFLLFNGEIYNYQALRERLTDRRFETTSDTEVILRLYEQCGIAAFGLLDGMFALAILDHENRRIVVARDAVGKKPLYVAVRGARVAFSSDATLLGALCEAPLNRHALGYYLEHGYCDPQASLFEGITAVPPGDVLTWDFDAGGDSARRTRMRPVAPPTPEEGAIDEQVDAAVRRAIEKRITNVKRPVLFLSGGLDSTLIARYLRDYFEHIDALTIRSPLPWELDYPYAKEAAARYGLDLEPVTYPVRGLSETLESFVARQDEPIGVLSYVPLAFMSARAIGRSKIVFTGDGGDETFYGYDSIALWTDGPTDPESAAMSSGPPLPAWVGARGRRQAAESLVGHSFARLDRAVSEMGLEVRCPLCDYALMAVVRSQPRERVLSSPKQLVKTILSRDFPDSFINRQKGGFATRIKYYQALDGFRFIRSHLGPRLKQFLDDHRAEPSVSSYTPTAVEVFRDFPRYWTLAVFGAFLERQGRL